MNKLLKISGLIAFAAIAVMALNSCKKAFDEPPTYIDPNMTATMTIKQLKALYSGTGYLTITGDDIISGIVVADDKSGNFYKSIVIQDSTAGILINMEGTNLYADYPVGRRVYVKVKNLILGNYGKLIQLGGFIDMSSGSPSLGGILSARFNDHIIKGSIGNVVTPKVVSIGQLDDTYQNMLIRLEGMEFISADKGKTFADNVNLTSLNRSLADLAGSTIVLRTSGYANFAGALTPVGYGTVDAIYSVFNSTKQLAIRDLNDLKLTGSAPSAIFSENFESTTANTTIALAGWGNYSEAGTVKYQAKTFSSNKYAQMTAFGSGQASVKSWLVTPAINLGTYTNKMLIFQTIDGYNNGATFKAYISTNYTGNATPWTATWTELPATISSGNTSGYASSFLSSGFINLNAYSGNIYIAFKYDGGDPGKTTTYQVDNIKVIAN